MSTFPLMQLRGRAGRSTGTPLLVLLMAGLLVSTLAGMYSRIPLYSLSLQLLVGIVFLGWLFTGGWRSIPSLGLSRWGFWVPLALLLISVAISTASSVQRDASLRMGGQWLSYLLVFLLSASLLGHSQRYKLTINLFVLLGLAAGLLGILGYLVGTPQAEPLWTGGSFRYHNFYAGYLLLLLPVSLALYLQAESRRALAFYAMVAVVIVDAFCMSYSRGGWIALAAAVLLLLYLLRHLPARQMAGRLLVLLLLVGMTLIPLGWGSFGWAASRNLGTVEALATQVGGETAGDTGISGRGDYARASLAMMGERPLMGSGLDTWGLLYYSYQGNPCCYAQVAHNSYLQIGSEAGIPAALTLLWLLGALLWRWLRRRGQGFFRQDAALAGLGAGLLAAMIHNLGESGLYFPALGLLFAAQAGVLVAWTSSHPQESVVPRGTALPKAIGWALAGVAILVFGVWALQWGSQLLLHQGYRLQDQGATVEAASRYALASRLNPWSFEGPYRLALLYEKDYMASSGDKERLPQALEQGKRAVASGPWQAKARLLLFRLYANQERLSSPALGQLEQAAVLRQPYHMPGLYLILAREYAARGDLEGVQHTYGKLVEALTPLAGASNSSGGALAPAEVSLNLAQGHVGLGNVAMVREEWEEAAHQYRVAQELDPANPVPHFNLGVALYEAGKLEESLHSFDRFLSLEPGSAQGHYYIGLVYEGLEHPSAARDHFGRALELDPGFHPAAVRLANLSP